MLNIPAKVSSQKKLDIPYKIRDVLALHDMTFLITVHNQVIICGANERGHLGLNKTSEYADWYESPVIHPSLNDTASISGTLLSSSPVHVLALGRNGKVKAFGELDFLNGVNEQYIPYDIKNLTDIIQVAAGRKFSLFLDKYGFVWVSGVNNEGQLGLGDLLNRINITRNPNLNNIVEISSGMAHSIVRDSQGRVWVFGSNDQNRCGLVIGDVLIPTKLDFGNISKVLAGAEHTVLLQNGGLIGMGSNFASRMGASISLVVYPARFLGFWGVQDIFLGPANTFIIHKQRRRLFAMGLGDTKTLGFQPYPVGKLKIKSFETFAKRMHAITEEDQLFSSGTNNKGQLGLGDLIMRFIPTRSPLASTSNPIKVFAGVEQTIVLLQNGDVYSCGNVANGHGSVKNIFTKLEIPQKIVDIGGGQIYTLFQTNSGDMYGCGDNYYYILDPISPVSVPTPTKLSTIQNVTKFWAQSQWVFFLVNETKIFAVGRNEFGQLGFNHTLVTKYPTLHPFFDNRLVDLCQSLSASYMIRSDGTLFVWGDNSFAQLGLNRSSPGELILSPTRNTLFPNSTLISCSSGQAVLVKSQNSFFGFGTNNDYLIPSDPLSSMVVNPTDMQFTKAVDQINLDSEYVIFSVTCNNTHTGMNCDQPICFGYPSSSYAVCTSNGECMAPDICKCYEPSFGSQCENNAYEWMSATTDKWSSGVWTVNRQGGLFSSPPPTIGTLSAVYFYQQGTYNVTIDVPEVFLTLLHVNPLSKMHWILEKTKLVVDRFEWSKVTTIYVKESSLTLKELHIISTSLEMLDSTLSGNLQVEKSGIVKMTSTVLSDLNLLNDGTMYFYGGFYAQNSKIENHGTIYMYGSNTTISQLVQNGTLVNNGQIYIMGTDLIRINASVVNSQKIIVQNASSVFFNGNFSQTKSASLDSIRSNLIFETAVTISAGSVSFGGSVKCPDLVFNSSNGYFTLSQDLNFNGNLTLSEASTTFWTLSEIIPTIKMIHGSLKIATLLIIRPQPGITPLIGHSYKFSESNSMQVMYSNIKLFGAPFKNGQYRMDGQNLWLDIQSSFGGVAAVGYKCTYLGDRRVLESNYFQSQEKVIITITTPIRDGLFGFGFDLNGTIQSSWFVVTSLNTSFQSLVYKNHINQSLDSPFMIIDSTKSQTIFNVGPEYHSIALLVSVDLLASQSKIYVTEFRHSLASHQGNISYQYSILKDSTKDCTNFLKPSRIESEHAAPLSIMLGLYVIIFILLVSFVTQRPLNTRGISPILTVFFLFTQLLLEVRNYFEIPEFQGSLCVFFAYGIYPLQQIVFIVIFVYFSRYISIINLNENKNLIAHNIINGNEVTKLQKVKDQVLKTLSSPWFTLILILSFYGLLNIIFSIPLAISGYYCSFNTLLALKIINNVGLILVYFLTFASFVVDFLIHFQTILRCNWIDYIFNQDPYWFRAQMTLYIPFMMYVSIVETVDLFSTFNYYSVVRMHRAITITNTITATMLLFIIAIIPLLLTIISFIIQKSKRKVRSDLVRNVMFDPDLAKIFLKFCESEFSVENYYAFLEIEEFKKTKKDPKSIYDRFLNGSASMLEINVSRKKCNEILEKLTSGTFDTTLFSDVERDVYSNLCDTFMRFSSTTEYKLYLKNTQKATELLEGKIQ